MLSHPQVLRISTTRCTRRLKLSGPGGFGEAYDGFSFESDLMPLARIIGRVYRELSSPKC